MLRDILHFGHTRTYLVLGPTAQIQPLGYDFCDIDVRTSDIPARCVLRETLLGSANTSDCRQDRHFTTLS